jgi:glycosyltransferase involved in cell wall biosynthesis
MMSDTPRVSVIIPVFDHARYLAEAVQSALDQSLPPAEVIVVDDGSTDGSDQVAASFGRPVRLMRQDHAGPSAARNLGISEAIGTHIALLDLVVGEWADWIFRANELGLATEVVPDVVVHRRLHDQNQGLRAADSRSQYLRVVKAALDRRRVASETKPGESGPPPERWPSQSPDGS